MKAVNAGALGKLIVARFSTGDLVVVGKCIAYCDAPTVTIERLDGERVHWRADMCSVADLDDIEVASLWAQSRTPKEPA